MAQEIGVARLAMLGAIIGINLLHHTLPTHRTVPTARQAVNTALVE